MWTSLLFLLVSYKTARGRDSLVVTTSHPGFDFLAGTWKVVKKLVTSLSDENIVLQTDTTKVLETLHLLLDEELGSGRIGHSGLDGEFVEVHTRLAGDTHASDERTSGTKLADTRLLDALVATREASNIMGIKTDEVTKTVGHEDSTHVLLHHLIDVTDKETTLDQLGQADALSKTVHVGPHHTRLHLSLDTALHGKHSLVDITLVLSELAVCREGGGQITIIAVVFAAAVDEDHIAVLDLTVVGESGVTVVECGSIGAASADGSVADVTATTVEVAVVQESGLKLILVHARLDGAHDSLVGLSGHAHDVAHDLDLSGALADAALGEISNKLATVNTVLVETVKVDLSVRDTAVGVDTRKNVDDLGVSGSDVGGELVHELAIVDLVLGLVEGRRLDLAKDDLERLWETRDVEGGEALHVHGGIEVGLHHTEEVLEVALLLENELDIAVIDGLAVTTAENEESIVRHLGSLEALQKTSTIVLVHRHRDFHTLLTHAERSHLVQSTDI